MLPVDAIRLNFNPVSLAVHNGVLAFLMFGIALDTRIESFRRLSRIERGFRNAGLFLAGWWSKQPLQGGVPGAERT